MGLKRSLRFLGVTVVMATLLSFIALAPVAADTTGATLKGNKTTTTQRVALSDGTNEGDTVDFIGNGFGPGATNFEWELTGHDVCTGVVTISGDWGDMVSQKTAPC